MPVTLPDQYSLEWARSVHEELRDASWRAHTLLPHTLPAVTATGLLSATRAVLAREATVVKVQLDGKTDVIVVGDTHGQLHDLLHMLDLTKAYAGDHIYVFNGDYVDRGAWGLELLLCVCALKLAAPDRFFMLRGNHESGTISKYYGFQTEVKHKYAARNAPPAPDAAGGCASSGGAGPVPTDARPATRGKATVSRAPPAGNQIIQQSKELFKELPLAALVGDATLVVHGGLWRKPPPMPTGKRKRGKRRRAAAEPAPGAAFEPGTLADLRACSKGGVSPLGWYAEDVLQSQALWSDPVSEAGVQLNAGRGGIGLVFGPDATEQFMRANGLRLVVRSHEGPDARHGRDDMPSMDAGFSLDHDTPCGQLVTVFSAPDYPQFRAPDETRGGNRASVLRLAAADPACYEVVTFSAAPRPTGGQAFYDTSAPGSDDEMALGGEGAAPSEASTASAVTDASEAATDGDSDDGCSGPEKRGRVGAAGTLPGGADAGGEHVAEAPPLATLYHTYSAEAEAVERATARLRAGGGVVEAAPTDCGAGCGRTASAAVHEQPVACRGSVASPSSAPQARIVAGPSSGGVCTTAEDNGAAEQLAAVQSIVTTLCDAVVQHAAAAGQQGASAAAVSTSMARAPAADGMRGGTYGADSSSRDDAHVSAAAAESHAEPGAEAATANPSGALAEPALEPAASARTSDAFVAGASQPQQDAATQPAEQRSDSWQAARGVEELSTAAPGAQDIVQQHRAGGAKPHSDGCAVVAAGNAPEPAAPASAPTAAAAAPRKGASCARVVAQGQASRQQSASRSPRGAAASRRVCDDGTTAPCAAAASNAHTEQRDCTRAEAGAAAGASSAAAAVTAAEHSVVEGCSVSDCPQQTAALPHAEAPIESSGAASRPQSGSASEGSQQCGAGGEAGPKSGRGTKRIAKMRAGPDVGASAPGLPAARRVLGQAESR